MKFQASLLSLFLLANTATAAPKRNNMRKNRRAKEQEKAINSSIEIRNMVYIGDDQGQSCETDVPEERVSGIADTTVTYCFEVTNKGDTDLTKVIVKNGDLSFKDDSIGQLGPNESAIVTYTTTIKGDLENTVSVSALPSKGDVAIANVSEVTDSDTSSVIQQESASEVTIENTVYLVENEVGGDCPGEETVEAANGAEVVYCFSVTNTGTTMLKDVTVTNADLGALVDNSIGTLKAGETKTVQFSGSIDGTLENTAVVSGKPATEDGTLIEVAKEVTASDKSEVREASKEDIVLKDHRKLYAPPDDTQNTCLDTNWENAGNSEALVCAFPSVQIAQSEMSADNDDTCEDGGTFLLSADATVIIQATEGANDLGWYIATDGGDAKTGTCIANGVQDGNTYNIVDDSGVPGGRVKDNDGDVCRDVEVDGEDGAQMTIPLVVQTSVKCTDEDDDGVLDVAVCFTWRADEENGNECSFGTNVPGVAMGGCYCTRVNIPNVDVKPPTDNEVDSDTAEAAC